MKEAYRGQHIRCSEEKMISAIKLFNLGANSETMRKFMGTSVSRHITFVNMFVQGRVYFLDGSDVKYIDTTNERYLPIRTKDKNYETVNEDLYGGVQGKLPEVVVLWDNYQETIKQYKDRYEKMDRQRHD
jgi:hypothetical protein